ncbi:MAG: MATE family efflux transporter, partial [Ruminiclostridium sp.]|nr:MATE family efflux transporter [Ruminiclostridium sp.]
MSKTDQTLDLTQGVIWKQLLLFLVPIAVGTLFQQFYNTADAIIVGQFVGAEALAAVGGSAAVIIQFVVGLFTGLSSGATVVISHAFGGQDKEKLHRAVHTAIAFSIVAGGVITLLGVWLAPDALRWTRNPGEIMAPATSYLRIIFLGTIPVLLFNMGAGILRAVGDSRRPLYYLIVCCLLNVVLDLVFVAFLRMGVSGAALATILANLVSAVLILIQLVRTTGDFRLVPRQVRVHGPTLKHVLYIGIPAAIEASMYSVSNLLIQVPINELGTDVVAAWSAAGKLDGIYWSLMVAFASAILAFVGQNYGAGRYDRMSEGVRVCLKMALALTVVLGGILLLVSPFAFRIFTNDPEVIHYSILIMYYFVPFYFMWPFIEVLANALRGAGDAVVPMVISVGGICGVRLLWIFLVVPHWHTLLSISVCYPLSWLVTAVVLIVYYKKANWAADDKKQPPSDEG